MQKYDKLMFIFIIALPLIDIITSFTVQLPLSIGSIIRSILMILLFVYLLRENSIKSLFHVSLFVIPFIFVGITFILNLFMKDAFLFAEEFKFMLKTIYYLIMLSIAIAIIEKQTIRVATILTGTSIASIITGLSFWIAMATKTNMTSYAYVKEGYSGWFFSANELSVIVIILLTFAIIHFHRDHAISSLVAYSLLLSITPMIGTKTAFYGSMIIALSYFIFSLFHAKRKMNLAVIVITVLFIFLLPFTPIITNQTATEEPVKQHEEINTDKQYRNMLSSRDVYLAETKADFHAAHVLRKLLGLGYAGDYTTDPKTIEMDFYELFFSYGIIGAIMLLIPFIRLSKKIITYSFSIPYSLLLLTCALCIGIAFVAGHVLFAPAVMSYVALLAIVTGLPIERSANLHEN